jgi:hypothetical protein
MNKETLEEAAEKEFPLIDTEWCRTGACEEENFQLLGHRRSFIKGAEWMQERMYSAEDMRKAYDQGIDDSFDIGFSSKDDANFNKWFEQFKKK